ncbi:S8 family serine peptidase [Paracoccus salsus]|uniref:S8 family serine peptidase n=1 Tax=Paracoccus salsus TaxID=2911061 RepID=UPI001F3E59B6|nr:S8 family serine peptidase [Paracoccus salsus]MCF3974274.1 S8 family serine peptidase [Paracoccus salsus]
MRKIVLFLLLGAMSLTAQPRPDGAGGVSLIAVAQADDHDDDDDDGGGRRARNSDDDDDDGRRVRDDDDDDAAPVRRRVRRQAAPPPLPQRAENEILARGLAEDDLAALLAQGFDSLESDRLGTGRLLVRLRKPAALGMNQALAVVRGLAEAEGSDFNHFYRTEQGEECRGIDCPARLMIGWPETPQSCGPLPRIGMVDTGLNVEHSALAGARIELHRLQDARPASDLLHGTAVAALLVGDSDSRAPGLVPQAELLAVDAFHRAGQDQRSDAFSLIRALDYLSRRQVRIVNLSLAGPGNAALEAQIARMDAQGILMIAAAGNNGPAAPPAYPAAYPQVLAVTAVDRRGVVYRRAGRGPHIDLAAPGVDVWTAASISGARTKTGTSYAAPFVSAAAALMLQGEPELSNAALRARLLGDARDLGAEGRDDIFGQGLVTPRQTCR